LEWRARVRVGADHDGAGRERGGVRAARAGAGAPLESRRRRGELYVAGARVGGARAARRDFAPGRPTHRRRILGRRRETGAAAIGDLPGNGVRDAPQRYSDDPASIEDLLAAPSIWCDFDVGNNQGIRIDGQLTTAGAAWVGDPIELDLLDVDPGTARLRGSLGATGSRKGEVKMRVIVDGARIHLMGLLPTGTLQTVTIYGDRSDSSRDGGRHIALLSRHEPGAFLTYGVQYLGSCE
jgi:hypothetical protein